mmetsp:Transcript_38106/g.99718  ORF Transcript_38106/g.99718 Transcript_38106/m.99718 type:complete len:709 (+) Transcript_38106:47-2173(+)
MDGAFSGNQTERVVSLLYSVENTALELRKELLRVIGRPASELPAVQYHKSAWQPLVHGYDVSCISKLTQVMDSLAQISEGAHQELASPSGDGGADPPGGQGHAATSPSFAEAIPTLPACSAATQAGVHFAAAGRGGEAPDPSAVPLASIPPAGSWPAASSVQHFSLEQQSDGGASAGAGELDGVPPDVQHYSLEQHSEASRSQEGDGWADDLERHLDLAGEAIPGSLGADTWEHEIPSCDEPGNSVARALVGRGLDAAGQEDGGLQWEAWGDDSLGDLLDTVADSHRAPAGHGQDGSGPGGVDLAWGDDQLDDLIDAQVDGGASVLHDSEQSTAPLRAAKSLGSVPEMAGDFARLATAAAGSVTAGNVSEAVAQLCELLRSNPVDDVVASSRCHMALRRSLAMALSPSSRAPLAAFELASSLWLSSVTSAVAASAARPERSWSEVVAVLREAERSVSSCIRDDSVVFASQGNLPRYLLGRCKRPVAVPTVDLKGTWGSLSKEAGDSGSHPEAALDEFIHKMGVAAVWQLAMADTDVDARLQLCHQVSELALQSVAPDVDICGWADVCAAYFGAGGVLMPLVGCDDCAIEVKMFLRGQRGIASFRIPFPNPDVCRQQRWLPMDVLAFAVLQDMADGTTVAAARVVKTLLDDVPGVDRTSVAHVVEHLRSRPWYVLRDEVAVSGPCDFSPVLHSLTCIVDRWIKTTRLGG